MSAIGCLKRLLDLVGTLAEGGAILLGQITHPADQLGDLSLTPQIGDVPALKRFAIGSSAQGRQSPLGYLVECQFGWRLVLHQDPPGYCWKNRMQ